MFLSGLFWFFCNLLQQNISVELHIISMLKCFLFQLGEADAASCIEIFNLNIDDEGLAIVIT